MPPKDPDRRRAYQAAWRRQQRAAKKLEALTGKKPTPTVKKPAGARKSSPPVPSLGALAELSYEQWTAVKAQLGAEMIQRARECLAALEPGSLSAADCVRLVTEGARLVEAAAQGQRDEQDGPPLVMVVERLDAGSIEVIHRLLLEDQDQDG